MDLTTINIDDILSQLPPLPNEGLVAGGSIASIVYSMITGLKSEYSDIDVFRKATVIWDSKFKDIKNLYYEDSIYIISNVSMVNNINYIDIYSTTPISNIIDTFDINCCKIGIDLSTKQLIYTPEFDEFLQTRQIEVNNFNNIKCTLFRLLKKKRQFPDAYLDVDKIIGYIAHVIPYHETIKVKDYTNEHDLNLISKYFNERNNKIASIYKIPELSNIEIWDKNRNIVFKRLYGNGVKKWQREQWLELLKYERLSNNCIHNDNYFLTLPKGWKTQLSKIGKFVDEHRGLLYRFERFSLAEQIELFKFINNLVDVEGKWVIGIIETLQYRNNPTLSQLKDLIINEVTESKVKLTKVLVTPLPIDRHYLECEVIELVTSLQLMDEGKYNNHCVGGYSNSLNENHRIFSIRIDKYRFTCEFRINNTYRITNNDLWKLVQCKSFNNTTVDKYPTLKTRIEAVISWLLLQLEQTQTQSLNFLDF